MCQFFTDAFLKENMMGPNAVKVLAEMTQNLPFDAAERILDLGCGKGLSSLYLAEKFPATVFATDLWIPATENFQRFDALGFSRRIIPIHADAHDLPYADDYFDAAVSVDAYHYFGHDAEYLDAHLAPLIKKGGLIALGIPGLTHELGGQLPDEMAQSWSAEDVDTLHSAPWWQDILSRSALTEIVSVSELLCYEESWNDWLACDNPYAVNDRAAMAAGAGKYMNLVFVLLRRV